MDSENLNRGQNLDLSKEEYSSLRQEIMKSGENSMKIISGAFTITGAIITYLLSKDNLKSYVFLFPFIVLTPSVFFITSQIITTKRIAAYLIVFVESESNIKWETRLVDFDKLRIKGRDFHTKTAITIIYVTLGLICIFLYYSSLLKFRDPNFWDFCLTLLSFCFHLYGLWQYYKADDIWEKNEFIKHWQKLKTNENNVG